MFSNTKEQWFVHTIIIQSENKQNTYVNLFCLFGI